jgi:hypothetical protein
MERRYELADDLGTKCTECGAPHEMTAGYQSDGGKEVDGVLVTTMIKRLCKDCFPKDEPA